MQGKPNKLILEPLNFADDIVPHCNSRKVSRIQKLVGHIVCKLESVWMGLVPIFCWLIALSGGTWYCSGPGCPRSVFEK